MSTSEKDARESRTEAAAGAMAGEAPSKVPASEGQQKIVPNLAKADIAQLAEIRSGEALVELVRRYVINSGKDTNHSVSIREGCLSHLKTWQVPTEEDELRDFVRAISANQEIFEEADKIEEFKQLELLLSLAKKITQTIHVYHTGKMATELALVAPVLEKEAERQRQLEEKKKQENKSFGRLTIVYILFFLILILVAIPCVLMESNKDSDFTPFFWMLLGIIIDIVIFVLIAVMGLFRWIKRRWNSTESMTD